MQVFCGLTLFRLLFQHSERIYSRVKILYLAYFDMRDIFVRTVDDHAKKIKSLGINGVVIEPVYGAGDGVIKTTSYVIKFTHKKTAQTLFALFLTNHKILKDEIDTNRNSV